MRDVVVTHRVNEGAVRPALHRAGRHHDHLLQRVDQQPHVDELSGPQLDIGVRELGLQFHRAGRCVDLVVDHGQLAVVDHRIVVGTQRVDRQRSLGEAAIDLVEVLLRQVEQHRDRLDLGDDDDARRAGGVHDVAFVDHAHAGAAVDRGDDGRIAQRRARVLDRRFVGLNQRLILLHERALGIGLLAVDGVGGGECLVARQIVLGVGEHRLVLRLLGDRLIELGLIDGRIDARQHVALLDVLAFLETHAEELAVDLRAHRHGVERLHRADGVEIDRHVGAFRRGDENRHRPAIAGKAAAAGRLRRRAAEVIDRARREHDHQRAEQQSTPAAALRLLQELLGRFTVHRWFPPVSAASRRRAPDRG